MANSNLKNKKFTIPQSIKQLIQSNSYQSERKTNLLGKDYLSYYNVKNYIRDYDSLSNNEKKSIGGKKFINWCENQLKLSRNVDHNHKKMAKAGGRMNSFIKPHEKGQIKVTKQRIPRVDKSSSIDDIYSNNMNYENKNNKRKTMSNRKVNIVLNEAMHDFLEKHTKSVLFESVGYVQEQGGAKKVYGDAELSIDLESNVNKHGEHGKHITIEISSVGGETGSHNSVGLKNQIKNDILELCADCSLITVLSYDKPSSFNFILTMIAKVAKSIFDNFKANYENGIYYFHDGSFFKEGVDYGKINESDEPITEFDLVKSIKKGLGFKSARQKMDNMHKKKVQHKEFMAQFEELIERMEQASQDGEKRFTIKDDSFKTLPPEIKILDGVTNLRLDIANLQKLPEEIGDITSLKSLAIVGSPQLKELPKSMGDLKQLEKLYLSGSGISDLPKSFLSLDSLKMIVVVDTPLNDSVKDGYHGDINITNKVLYKLARDKGVKVLANLNGKQIKINK